MSCLECKEWNLRGYREMAMQGFGLCNKGPKWEYKPPQHKCSDFRAEEGEKVLKRIEWLRKIRRLPND